MKKKFSFILFFSSLFIFGQTIPEYDKKSDLEDYNFVLGTQGIGGYYKFTDESALIEQAKHIRAMGSNILKISLGKKSQKVYGLPIKKVKSTKELFLSNKDYKIVFDMDFKFIFTWVHSLTQIQWKKGINKKEEQILYNEMYEFVSYLLKEYNNSGKTFMIGNWEGDWLLHPEYNRKITPPKKDVKNMTKWFQIRQKAIDDAKKKTKHKNVQIYHYIELNLALKGMNGDVCIAEDILPKVDVDLVSYSSYEAIKKRNFEEKTKTLTAIFNYLEKQLKPKKDIPFTRRVFIGEYGYQANINNPQSFVKQHNQTKEIMQIALALNLPFALHWEMYNNEYHKKTGQSKEMSLINEQGMKTSLYFLHQAYYKRMNAFLKEYNIKNNSYPDSEAFKKEALNILRTL
jgi:hypothetical protein